MASARVPPLGGSRANRAGVRPVLRAGARSGRREGRAAVPRARLPGTGKRSTGSGFDDPQPSPIPSQPSTAATWVPRARRTEKPEEDTCRRLQGLSPTLPGQLRFSREPHPHPRGGRTGPSRLVRPGSPSSYYRPSHLGSPQRPAPR